MAHENTIAKPERPQFTPGQLLQASYIGQVTDAQRKRRSMPTYPIDNVGPETVADRDDGIYVEAEETKHGGYRVHITIADVAAHVRADSLLAKAAWQRGFTVYGPGWTDPMFPKLLEENLSLEHNKERLGMTVSITLDEHFHPVHTNFKPVITKPDNSSYQQAQERMQKEPQFRLMQDIALGIRHHHFKANDEIWTELLKDMFNLDTKRSGPPSDAQEMVATYMILANNCVAEYFKETGLPFLYRNFDTTLDDTHAHYDTYPLKHTALEKAGLKGAYCHFTSPIRRAPDYFNGIMAHYVVKTLDDIQAQIHKRFPEADEKVLNKSLWEHPEIFNLLKSQIQVNKELHEIFAQVLTEASLYGAPPAERQLMPLVRKWNVSAMGDRFENMQQQLQESVSDINPAWLRKSLQRHPEITKLTDLKMQSQAARNKDLMALLSQIIAEASPGNIPPAEYQLMSLVRELDIKPPPLSYVKLTNYSDHINALNHSPEMREIGKMNEKLEIVRERIDLVADTKPEELERLTPEKFSSLLHAADQADELPRKLYDEALERLKNGKVDRAKDYFTIFAAQHPKVPRWLALKREVARSLKHDPGLVNTIYTKLEQQLRPGKLEVKTLPMPTNEFKENGEPQNITGALVIYEDQNHKRFAAPFYSVGHNMRSAKSHALYSFLEYYAFGQLQPVEQTAVPNLLYAELEVEGVAKYDLLKKMVDSMDAKLQIKDDIMAEGGRGVRITVEGGELQAPVVVTAVADTVADATQTALRHVLRDPVFKAAASRSQPQSLSENLNPQTILEELVANRGGTIEFLFPTKEQRGVSKHKADIKICLNGVEKHYTGEAPNIDRAKRLASVNALRKFGWVIEGNGSTAQSWVTDASIKRTAKDIFSPPPR